MKVGLKVRADGALTPIYATMNQKIVRLHLEEGRSLKGLAEEYGVSKASISIWTKQFREECQTNDEAKADYDMCTYL